VQLGIGGFHLVDHVCFAGPDFVVLASSGEHHHVDMSLEDPAVKEAVLAGRSYSTINRENGQEVYDIYVPVYLADEFVGTLVVGKYTGQPKPPYVPPAFWSSPAPVLSA